MSRRTCPVTARSCGKRVRRQAVQRFLLIRRSCSCFVPFRDVMGAKWEQIVRVASDTSQREEFVIRPDDDSSTVTFLLRPVLDRKSTRLNSSHRTISYAVFCLKKKK